MKKKVSLISLFLIGALALIAAPASPSDYIFWPDSAKPFSELINICGKEDSKPYVVVMVNHSSEEKNRTEGMSMRLTLKSNTSNYDIWGENFHPDFTLFSPKIKVNDDKERKIPVDTFPAEQTVEMKVNLRPGENKIVLLLEFNSGIRCVAPGENCKGCGFFVKLLEFRKN